MGLLEITKQVKDNCPCFEDKKDDEVKVMVEKLINLLSASLCWDSSICSNFIRHEEVEEFNYIDESCFKCDCSTKLAKFDLFYTLKDIHVQISEVTLITYNGLSEIKTVIDNNSYTYRNGQILIEKSALPNTCCTCSCDEFVLSVAYETGFDLLPECLVSIFCDLLVSMSLSLSGCGSVEECCSMSKPKAYSYLKTKKQGEISYSWGVDDTHISYIFEKMFDSSTLKKIGMLSLCNAISLNKIWWGKSC